MKLKMIIASFIAATAIFFTVNFQENKVEASNDGQAAIASEYLEAYAYQFLGTRYVYGGTSASGFDCSGYVRHIYKQFDVELNRTSSGMYEQGESVEVADLQLGDLVFFKTTAAKVGHVGIYLGNGQFVHSATGKGVIVSSIYDPYYWSKRYVGAKRVANVTPLASIVASND